jgi:xylulokinase
MGKYVLGVDIGTTGSKAMVLDLDGNILGSASCEYPLEYPEANAVEIKADYLMENVYDVVAEAVKKSGADKNDIVSLSFSVQRATFCLLDEKLEPIENRFYVWLDNRAEVIMEEIYGRMDRKYMFCITGQPITRTYSVEKLYWIKKYHPDIYNKTKYFALVDAYAMWKFGGDRFVTETSNAMVSGMMDVRNLQWNKEVMTALDLRFDILPPLLGPGKVAGKVSAEIAARTGLAEGTLIVGGSGDQQAAAMGAAVIEDGSMSLTLGTVGELVVGLAKPNFAQLENLMIPSTPELGIFEIEGNQISGATCYRWARDVLCPVEVALGKEMGKDPFVMMEDYINKSVPGSNGVIFQAALFGTGYPTNSGEATASFLGLKSSHTRADLVRSVMEGITLETRFIYEAIKATGVKLKDSITITGGATKSPGWRQIIADVLNCRLLTLEVADASIIGVGILAAIGAGLFTDTKEGVARMVRTKDEI